LSDAPLAGLSVILPLVTVQLESSRIGAGKGEIDQKRRQSAFSATSKCLPVAARLARSIRWLRAVRDVKNSMTAGPNTKKIKSIVPRRQHRRKSQGQGISSENDSPGLGLRAWDQPLPGREQDGQRSISQALRRAKWSDTLQLLFRVACDLRFRGMHEIE